MPISVSLLPDGLLQRENIVSYFPHAAKYSTAGVDLGFTLANQTKLPPEDRDIFLWMQLDEGRGHPDTGLETESPVGSMSLKCLIPK